MTDDAVYSLEQNFGAHHYDLLNVVVKTTQDSWITDLEGRKYLDFLKVLEDENLAKASAIQEKEVK